ncbi:DUF6538 domain-containing protein [Martelella endophytica]|uniref:Integrase n=1 Tax=Martelella endophytica TaxID=1486262 RepID=A0A0D5LRF5_MAREN|nr:tyrosine-type recombinase/integrase [Martelella endophytica]AJY46510.1 integrase [Martelella endophytica]
MASNGRENPDRFLQRRSGIYAYVRRVPAKLAAVDERSPAVRISLGTRDLSEARVKRDIHEEADNALWASMLAGGDREQANARYKAAVARAHALGFSYRTAMEILASETGSMIHDRLMALSRLPVGGHDASAVVGLEKHPRVPVSEAFSVYTDEIAAPELTGKSDFQRFSWLKVKRRALNNFIEVVGDKPIDEITRQDATKFYNFWLTRIAPKDGRATHTASSGNRDVGNMRKLFADYHRYRGLDDVKNPFAGLSFSQKVKTTRPPFPTEWISKRILRAGALAGLNDEARAILLALIETGARPSEICNLTHGMIDLNADVPHILIEPRSDPDDRREIKTASSIRAVPLVGVALAAMRAHPDGFPRYKNKENGLSATLNKFFRENKLFPSSRHKIYSLRHSFEDRMKEAGVDTELRMMIMGHTIDRPQYGAGGSLSWKRDALEKIKLDFDEAIL